MILLLSEINIIGVATYKTLEDMPEKLRKVLPDIKEMQKLLDGEDE